MRPVVAALGRIASPSLIGPRTQIPTTDVTSGTYAIDVKIGSVAAAASQENAGMSVRPLPCGGKNRRPLRTRRRTCRYPRLPTAPDSLEAAVEASLALRSLGDRPTATALWCSMYLAPLASILQPDITIWLWGPADSTLVQVCSQTEAESLLDAEGGAVRSVSDGRLVQAAGSSGYQVSRGLRPNM